MVKDGSKIRGAACQIVLLITEHLQSEHHYGLLER